MGVERGGASGAEFVFGQQRSEFFVGFLPLGLGSEYLRDAAPADVLDEDRLFLVRGCPGFGLKLADQPDGGEIGLSLLFERPLADAVGGCDTVICAVTF